MWDYLLEPMLYYLFPLIVASGTFYFLYGLGLRVVKVGDKFATE